MASRAGPRELWERSETGGVCANERHLRATNTSYLSRSSSGRIKGGMTTVKHDKGPGLDYLCCVSIMFICGSRPWGAVTLLLFSVCLFYNTIFVEFSLVTPSSFPEPLTLVQSQIYEFYSNNNISRNGLNLVKEVNNSRLPLFAVWKLFIVFSN